MSTWAPEAKTPDRAGASSGAGGASPDPNPSLEASGPGSEGGSPSSRAPRWPIPLWRALAACSASAALFLSGLFVLFSPLPVLFLRFRAGRLPALGAAACNVALVLGLGGLTSLGVYSLLVLPVALGLPELMHRRRSLESSILVTLLLMVGVAAAWLFGYAQLKGLEPWGTVRTEIHTALDLFLRSVPEETREALLQSDSVEDWKRSVIQGIPWRAAVFALMMTWLNALLVLRLNPARIRERMGIDSGYFRRWKAPEALLWPSILCGIFLVIDVPRVSVVAWNAFMFVMAVYAIHGLSILSFFFDVWNIRGFMRSLGYLITIMLVLQLLPILGFFDQWFDFRARFRQT